MGNQRGRDAGRRSPGTGTSHRGPGQPGTAPTRVGAARPGCCLMLVLDAGAFVAVERGVRKVVALVKRERLAGRPPVTSGGVVAQVWRGGSGRQAPLARLLAGVDVAPVDDRLGRRAGMLLARSGHSDAIDATVVCLAADGDDILTSDHGDLRALAEAAAIHVELIPVRFSGPIARRTRCPPGQPGQPTSVCPARYQPGAPRHAGTARPRLADHRAGSPGAAGS